MNRAMPPSVIRAIALACLLGTAGSAGAAPDIDLERDCKGTLPLHTFNARTGVDFFAQIRLFNDGGRNVFWGFSAIPAGDAPGMRCDTVTPDIEFRCANVTIALPEGAARGPVSPALTARISGTPSAVGSFPFAIVLKVEDTNTTCEMPYLLKTNPKHVDGVAPSPPQGVTVSVATSGPRRVTLRWLPSIDDSGRAPAYLLEKCEGQSCTHFSTLERVEGTVFNDRQVPHNTEYNYRVRAVDAAGNLSEFSEVASVHMGDDHPQ